MPIKTNPNPSAAQKGIRVSHHSSNRRPERPEDSILIDEARTPLIISESVPAVPRQFEAGREVANALKKDLHYTVDEKNMNATQPYIFLFFFWLTSAMIQQLWGQNIQVSLTQLGFYSFFGKHGSLRWS